MRCFAGPAVQRAALVNLGELATYDTAKTKLIETSFFEDNVFCHTAASMVSGLFAAIMSTPMDVAKTRLIDRKSVV